MKLHIAAFLALVAILPCAAACDYYLHGDSECDPANNTYCISYVCTKYSGSTTIYCNDPDGNNAWVSGSTTYRYRDYSGYFLDGNLQDECLWNSQFVSYCSPGSNCSVREVLCKAGGTGETDFAYHACADGCNAGKCAEYGKPDSTVATSGQFTASTYPGIIVGTASDSASGVATVEIKIVRESDYTHWNGTGWIPMEFWLATSGTENWAYSLAATNISDGNYGVKSKATDKAGNIESEMGYNKFEFKSPAETACDYEQYRDGQCDTNNGFYCIEYKCTKSNTAPKAHCTDADGLGYYSYGIVDFNYRSASGTIVDGNKDDYCVSGDERAVSCTGSNCKVMEMACKKDPPYAGLNYYLDAHACENGCNSGACIYAQEQAETCDDNIMNCHSDCMSHASTEECCETGIDCGGPCGLCEETPAEEIPPELPLEELPEEIVQNENEGGNLGSNEGGAEEGTTIGMQESAGNEPQITAEIYAMLVSAAKALLGEALEKAPLELLLLAVLAAVAATLAYNRIKIFTPQGALTTRQRQMFTALWIGAGLAVFFAPFAVNRIVDVRMGIVTAVVEIAVVLLANYAKKGAMGRKAIQVKAP